MEDRKMPNLELHMEITNRCNLQCKMCFRHTIQRKIGDMPFAMLKNILEQAKHLAVGKAFLHLHGEPLLYRELPEAITAVCQQIGHVEIYSNGLALTPTMSQFLVSSGLKKVNFSMTGFTNAVYHSFQGFGTKTDVERVKQNIVELVQIRNAAQSTMKIVLHYILTEESSEELEAYLAFWKPLVDDIEINFLGTWLGNMENHNQELSDVQPCGVLGRQIVVLVDGSVTGCCVDYRGDMILGDIQQQSIQEIFAAEPLQSYLQANQTCATSAMPAICAKCDQYTGRYIRGMRLQQYEAYQQIVAAMHLSQESPKVFFGVNPGMHHVYWTLFVQNQQALANIEFIDWHKQGVCYGQIIQKPEAAQLKGKEIIVFAGQEADDKQTIAFLAEHKLAYQLIENIVRKYPGA